MTDDPIIFAPLEGITDPLFREVILELYPEWSYVYTDFFRIPPEGRVPKARLISHMGESIYKNQHLRDKSPFQVLASPTSQTAQCGEVLEELQIPWVDLNVGCPSKKVNAHHGGAWLMSEPKELEKILYSLRNNYSGLLSVKIRSGFKDDSNFNEIIKIVEGEGADLLTVHPRTKTQMYLGLSDWSYIARAKKQLTIPVIGNGDIHTPEDVDRMKRETGCDGVMIGRGGVANPGLAALQRNIKNSNDSSIFLTSFIKKMEIKHAEEVCLKRLKSITHYLFDGEKKSLLLRSKTLSDYRSFL
ncbi:MAG: tRNA-dihydrouridine synthase family protein [Bacteriovoracaceae bacterium]|nr:tRNA-dihydrouridine synthase family protein [Bacteriovoracaceae bacterium]